MLILKWKIRVFLIILTENRKKSKNQLKYDVIVIVLYYDSSYVIEHTYTLRDLGDNIVGFYIDGGHYMPPLAARSP